MKTYLTAVTGCPGWSYPVSSLDEVCPATHVVVGDRVYHEKELPSSMWQRVHERREKETR